MSITLSILDSGLLLQGRGHTPPSQPFPGHLPRMPSAMPHCPVSGPPGPPHHMMQMMPPGSMPHMPGGPHEPRDHGGPPMGPHPQMMHLHPGHPQMQPHPRVPPYMSQPDYRVFEINKRLQQRSDDCDNLWWDSFATEFFEDDATLTVAFMLEDGPKRYTIGRTLIPRYFRSIFESGCSDLYYLLRQSRESFHTTSITLDAENTNMVMNMVRPFPTSVVVEGRLILEFTFDDLMRIRSWTFQIKQHKELVMRSVLSMQDPNFLEQLSKNLTRTGITNNTLNFFRLCVILEPMQELMSRQKAYSLTPRDCLKTTLFQKWQRMVAPPETNRQPNKRRKRKTSSVNNDGGSGRSKRKQSPPVPTLPNMAQPGDVMIVGEPTLMGGDFGDEDERMITRLENIHQYDPTAAGPSCSTSGAGQPAMHVMQTSAPSNHLPTSQAPLLDQVSCPPSSINHSSGVHPPIYTPASSYPAPPLPLPPPASTGQMKPSHTAGVSFSSADQSNYQPVEQAAPANSDLSYPSDSTQLVPTTSVATDEKPPAPASDQSGGQTSSLIEEGGSLFKSDIKKPNIDEVTSSENGPAVMRPSLVCSQQSDLAHMERMSQNLSLPNDQTANNNNQNDKFIPASSESAVAIGEEHNRPLMKPNNSAPQCNSPNQETTASKRESNESHSNSKHVDQSQCQTNPESNNNSLPQGTAPQKYSEPSIDKTDSISGDYEESLNSHEVNNDSSDNNNKPSNHHSLHETSVKQSQKVQEGSELETKAE